MAHHHRSTKVLRYTAIFEPDPDGGYTVTIPTLPGCISEGDTFESALRNVREAAGLYLETLRMRHRRAPRERRASFTAPLEVDMA
ncbi:type II toxin-antitoxin system HicB family antitoxin [Candidatus Uhrbacteria bacterium]|nr:type II toxin-antitoxin system HicB family antitoxin [Candidatus Uhrbacteria bacterium]